MTRHHRLESPLEPESGRLAFQARPRQLRPQRGCELVALPNEREKLGAPLCVLAQLVALRVGALERPAMSSDLGFELGPAAAVPPVEAPEFAVGRCESLFCALA